MRRPFFFLATGLLCTACLSDSDSSGGVDSSETGGDTGSTADAGIVDTGGSDDSSAVDAAAEVDGVDGPFGPFECDEIAYLDEPYTPTGCEYVVTHPFEVKRVSQSCNFLGNDPTPRMLHTTYPSARPQNTIAMSWATNDETRLSELRLGSHEDDLDRIYRGHTFDFTNFGDRLLHEVHVCDLEANRTYYYQVGGEGAWSDVYSFVTAPEPDSDQAFTFAVTGDSRSETQEMWGQAIEGMYDRGADLVLFSGDMVDTGGIQSQWDAWFTAAELYTPQMPLVPTIGNHDLYLVNYIAQFALPRDEDNYHIRYGNTLIIALDDMPLHDIMALYGSTKEYLRATLEEHADATWTILLNHQAFYSASSHGSTELLQDEWMPIVDEYEIDLVFNGHDHNYERTKPLRGNEVVSMGDGTIYVVAAGVGAPLYGNGMEWWTEYSESVPNYAIVNVDGNTLDFTAYRLDGTVIDEFTLTK